MARETRVSRRENREKSSKTGVESLELSFGHLEAKAGEKGRKETRLKLVLFLPKNALFPQFKAKYLPKR